MKNNPVGWFELPVTDMDRAIKFYNAVLNVNIQKLDFGGLLMGWFPFNEEGIGTSGSLVQQEEYKPSTSGVLIYFTAESGDLANELGRVESAGGTVLAEKKLISEDVGFMGLFLDSEGNRVALHSRE
ncbi:MAG: VOC family protein [Bacteroidetes bacterium]|nr:VOC family protein [Bacteroidota bacterium]